MMTELLGPIRAAAAAPDTQQHQGEDATCPPAPPSCGAAAETESTNLPRAAGGAVNLPDAEGPPTQTE